MLSCLRLLVVVVLIVAGGGSTAAHADSGSQADPSTRKLPHVCAAQWAQRSQSCGITEPLVVRAVGKTEGKAQKGAVDRLRAALGSLSQAAMLDAQGSFAALRAADLAGCGAVSEGEMLVTCMATPDYLAAGVCFADLPADPCWNSQTHVATGPVWEASEAARQLACGAFDEATDARGLRCSARCQTRVTIRCDKS